MRNEIFSRISQNRNQYYSELKYTQNKTKVTWDYIDEENIIIEDSIEAPSAKKTIFQPFNSFDYSLITLLYSTIKKKLIGWTFIVVENIKKTRDHIASKANIQSNKLTENLSKLSSQLFEDSYEFHGHEDISRDTEKFNDKSMAIGLMDSSGVVSTISLKPNTYQLIDQLNKLLYKIYRDIIIFLESDNWFEKINRSHKITPLMSKNMSVIVRNRTSQVLKPIHIISTLKEKKKNPKQTGNIDNPRNIFDLVYSKTKNILNLLKVYLFPAINRFI